MASKRSRAPLLFRATSNTITSGRLRVIERLIGGLDDRCHIGVVVGRPACGPDTGGHASVFAACMLDREFVDRGPDFLRDNGRPLRRRVQQNDNELLTAIAGRSVGRSPDVIADAARDRGQRIVAGLMAAYVSL